MASVLKKFFAPVALGAAILGLAGCGESPQDIAAKPAVVQQMVENSASICQTGPVHGDAAAYKERLTTVLSGANLSSLKTLQSKNITVCLDQRLENQSTGFWTGYSRGVFYPAANGQGGVMTYNDDGRQPSENTFWTTGDAYHRGSEAVNRLAEKASAGELPGPGGYMDVHLVGKGSYPHWYNINTNSGVLKLNPQLQQPPVKAPVAAPSIKPAS